MKSRLTSSLALVVLVLVGVAPPALDLRAARAAGPTVVDLLSTPRVYGLRASPDGMSVVYLRTQHTFDAKAEPKDGDDSGGWSSETQLWLLDLKTGDTRRLTSGAKSPSPASWSPDGRALAFVRAGALNVLPLTGGEPEVVATGKLTPSDVRFAPDGKGFFFVAEDAQSDAERAATWRSGGVVTWEGEWRPTRVWRLAREGGEPRAVTPADVHVTDWQASPDGTRVAALVSPSADPYVALMQQTARVYDASASSPTATATLERPPRPMAAPRWAPDGKTVALLRAEDGPSFMSAILVWDLAGNGVRDVSGSKDRTLLELAFTPDGKHLVAHEAVRTGSKLVRFARAGGAAPAGVDLGFAGRVIHEGGGLQPVLGGRAWLVLSSRLDSVPAPTVFEPQGKKVRVALDPAPALASWPKAEQEVVRWTCPEGVELEGLFARPPGVAKPPLVVMPHGGPDAVTDESYSGFVRLLVGRGYAVLRPNYRGGTAYGFDFYAANRGRFGDIELMDIESGVDALIAAGKVDATRLYFGGWSWGGYISAWTLTHTTRYLAHVVGAAIIDTTLQYVTSDINHGDIAQWEFKGDPWRTRDAFDRPSPIRHIGAAKAPTLVMHGLADDRVGFANSQLLYRALKDLGVPVVFYAYPDEPHGIGKPARAAHMLESWASWFDQHPRPSSQARVRGNVPAEVVP